MRKPVLILSLFFCCNLLCSSPATFAAFPKNTEGKKAVLITGASSGIGRLTAESLASAGHLVYAGARKQSDLEALDAIPNVRAIRLDVTRQQEIDAAYQLVKAAGHGLWGLVNNAGINLIDPMIEVDMDDLTFLFDVNVFGVVRVTKTFAPLIIDARGRVVVVSSISGILAGFPAYGGYAMTKHAIEAYIDQLSEEMKMLDVRVAGVEPGNFSSQIGMTRCRKIVEEAKQYRWYGDLMQAYFDDCKRRVSTQASPGTEPRPVASAIEDALFSATPKEHYLVTSDPFESQIVMRKSFERIHHLNLSQDKPYTREELLELYDDEKHYATGEKTRRLGE